MSIGLKVWTERVERKRKMEEMSGRVRSYMIEEAGQVNGIVLRSQLNRQ